MVRLLLSIFLILPAIAFARQREGLVDSVARLVQQHPARDSIRVAALLKLADGIVYSDPATAMRYADEALDIATAIRWTKGIALALRQKGNVYYVFADDSAAMSYYMRSLDVARPLDIRELNASLLNNLANIYSDLKQYDKALGYYRQFLEAARETGSEKEAIIALVNTGTVYTELGEHDKALECARQALDIAGRTPYFVPIILNNIGIAFSRQGKSDSAVLYFRRCLDSAAKYDNQDAKASALEETARLYLAKGDPGEARKYALASLHLGQQLHSAEWQSEAWESLYQVYERQGRYDQALDAYKRFITWKDSVSNEEKRSAMTKKAMQFDFERKEAAVKAEHDKVVALAQAEIKRQSLIKKMALAGVVLLLLAAGVYIILYKRRRDAEELARVSDTEMKVLRLQMNPHFIFNSLTSVSDYITKHETTTANHFLIKFAKMMRKVLENSEKSEITLAEDLQVLESYMQLEALRVRNGFSYEITVDGGIDPEATLVPPMIVQPFVENSIRHGLSSRSCAGKITIRVCKENEMIRYVVEDNGVGREKAGKGVTPGRRSMGISITRDRIDILNKTKRTAAGGVHVIDLPEGTRVELLLPLELSY